MYIGNDLQIAHPSYKIIDDISSGFNGSATSFALQVSGETPVPFPISTQQVMISVNGVVQEPDPNGSAGFKLLGSNIVFSSAPANGHAFFGVINAGADYVTAGSEFPDGSATAPSFTFQDDQDTGWFRSGSGAVGFSANGVNTIGFDGNGLTVTGDATFTGDSSKNLFWDKSDGQLEFADNAKAVFGTGSDLQIYHDSNNSAINHNGTGDFYIQSNNNLYIRNFGGDNYIRAIEDGAVELYHNNAKKLETSATGATITGTLVADGFTGPLTGNVTGNASGSAATVTGAAQSAITSLGVLTTLTNAGGTELRSDVHFNNGTNTGKDIYWDESDNALEFSDDVKATFGAGPDLSIYHTNNNSRITHSGTGNFIVETTSTGSDLYLRGDDKVLIQPADGEEGIVCNANGSVELYYNNIKQVNTTSTGLTLGDNKRIDFGDGADLQIYHSGSDNFITASTQNLILKTTAANKGTYLQSDAFVEITTPSAGETMAKFIKDGAVELYHNNVKKIETYSNGINVSGRIQFTDVGLTDVIEVPDGKKITVGSSGDCSLYHDGNHSYLDDAGTGDLKIRSNGNGVVLGKTDGENTARFLTDGAVELYYDNSKKFETTSAGVTVTGTVSDSIGELRQIPSRSVSSVTLATSDVGKAILATSTVTVPNSTFSAGDAVTIINNSGSDITISKSISTMYLASDGSSTNRTLATRGMATIWFASSTVAYISGAGLS